MLTDDIAQWIGYLVLAILFCALMAALIFLAVAALGYVAAGVFWLLEWPDRRHDRYAGKDSTCT